MEEREPKRPHQVPSSSSSSSPRKPDLLRQVRAAFKRQRPLPGAMPSSVSWTRRLQSSEAERGIITGSLGVGGNNGDKFQNNLGTEGVVQNVRESTPTFTGTVTSTHNEDNLGGGGVGYQVKSATDSQVDCRTERAVGFQQNSIDGSKRVEFSKAGDSSSCGALSQRAFDQMATGTAIVEKLSSHMGSLALTESKCASALQAGQEEVDSQKNHRKQDLQHTGLSEMSNTRSGVTHLLPKKEHFMIQSMTQSSVAGSSCATSTSVYSMSAPIVNSCTYNPRPNTDVETVEEFKLNPRPTSEGDFVTALGPAVQSTSAGSARQTAVSTQVSRSAPEVSLGSQGQSLSKGQGLITKENDNSKEVYLSDKSTKEEKGVPADDFDNIQSKAPETKKSSADMSVEPSQLSKTEKGATGRGTSGRKKNYDPDVFFKVNGKLYQKLGKIGSGGSSEVHKVISSDCTIYALKKIKLKGRDYSTACGFCQEIGYLKKLKGKNNIIELVDYEVTDKTLLDQVMNGSTIPMDGRIREDGYIYMVLEYGEIDLAHMLSQKWKDLDNSDWKIDENWLRFYWQQILLAVNTIHEERIVHSDLKPANFLLVRGSLKLIDFGIAKAIMSDTTNIQRDSQVGTLNYMSPEAFMWNEQDATGNTIKCGRSSDIWSLGCILYQMVYGQTPFAEYKTFWAKFKVITNQNHEIRYGPVSNPWLLDLMKKCLAWDRNQRWRIPQLLQHPFLVPPVPPQLSHSRDQHCRLLMEMAEVYANCPEVYSLFSQIQQLLTNLTEG